MKKYEIWKSWELMTDEEQKFFMSDSELLDCYLDNTGENIDTYDKEDFENYCAEVNNDYFMDDFGDFKDTKYSNFGCSKLRFQQVMVIGTLGLWDGKHKIMPKQFDNLNEAIYECLEDYNEIYEDSYGNLHIEAHHHDGTNHFVIKKLLDDGKMRCLHFRKEVYGC